MEKSMEKSIENPKSAEVEAKKLRVRAVKHLTVKTGVRAGTDTQDHTSSKNANNGEGWQ